jgi:S1-C subfamily serine protease
MQRRKKLMAGVLAAAAVGLVCRADELADKGRAIFQKHQRAVVTVQAVLKNTVSMPGMTPRSTESRQELSGTVVEASGLAVVALSAVDPAHLLQNMAGEQSRLKMDTELTDLKILTDDGTEMPAEIVLRDRDLDLAFIRPKSKPAAPMAWVDFAAAGKADVLDQVIALNRLGNAAGRAYSASVERISAVVQRPRLFYVPDASMTTTTLGAPAFTIEAKPLGIFVMRSLRGRGGGTSANMAADNLTSIIVPGDDILKALKQVPPAGETKP